MNLRFQDGAFVALKQLRNLVRPEQDFESDTRQTYRLFLENNKSQKRLVGRTKKLQSIKNLNTLSSNQYQKIEQLKTFTADAIDALYMLTTEKQTAQRTKSTMLRILNGRQIFCRLQNRHSKYC